MRRVATILLCLLAAACSSLPPPEIETPPEDAQLKAGLTAAVADSHFAKPVEVTDVIRAPASSTQSWMVCIRSASSEEARRVAYAAFFGKNATGKPGQYVRSRYATFAENCGTQTYHPFIDTPAPSASPSPTAEPKKHHKRHQ